MDSVARSLEDVGSGHAVAALQMLRNQGFAATRLGDHIPARAQRILSQACEGDARVAILETVFVSTVVQWD